MHPRTLCPILLIPSLLIVQIGCSPRQAPAKADLQATDAGSRVPAIVLASEGDDLDTTQELVRALMDDDAAVRLFAIQSLNKRYGQKLGYRYYDQAAQRNLAVAKWRQWLAKNVDPSLAQPPEEDLDSEPTDDTERPTGDETNDGQPDP